MDTGERFDNINVVKGLVKQTGVKVVWNLVEIVEQSSPPFDFDYVIGYSILGIVAMSSIMVPLPVQVNKTTISEMYEITMDEVEQYFTWFCKLGILRRYSNE